MPYDAQKIADKLVRRVASSTQDYRDGVMRVTTAPGVKAVQKKDKLRSNFLQALESGKWERNTSAVTLDEWQQAAASKGAERLATGVEGARDKILTFFEEFLPYVENVKKSLDQMPDATPEQRRQKMIANVEQLSKFRRTRRRR